MDHIRKMEHSKPLNLLQELRVAKEAALAAGEIQAKRLRDARKIEYKGPIDIVTDVDLACEESIMKHIKKNCPGDDILAEESGETKGSSSRKWIIDPLDGTVNYAHSFPFFAVSIALEQEGSIVLGVTYDALRKELFYAARGHGAHLNDERICVSATPNLNESMLATGFAYNVRQQGVPDNLDHFAGFIKRARAVRRPGSAALDLAYVACGRLDGFWEIYLKPWDIAAGKILVQEAGGLATDFSGKDLDIYGPEILTSNAKIHAQMQEVLLAGKKPK